MSDLADGQRYHFLYFADPMCSWCYGFAPVVRELHSVFGDRVGMRIVMGGLRAGQTQAMREKDRAYIRDAWNRVGAASGQPFDFAFFERETFVYDTEPACRAVVTMRASAPEKTLAYLGRVSAAFYAGNRDTTDLDVLAEVAAEAGVAADAFRELMASGDMRTETLRDFLFTQQSGVNGFPCLLIGNEAEGYSLVTSGFHPIDGMIEGITSWLDQAEAA